MIVTLSLGGSIMTEDLTIGALNKTTPIKLGKVHLILWAKGSDANTFHHAAKTLEKDYKKHYPTDRVIVKSFAHGKDFVDAINVFPDNSIVSLDVASHGNMFGVHISKKKSNSPAPKHHLYWHPALRHTSMEAIHGKKPQTVDDAVVVEEQMLGLYKDEDGLEWAARFFNQNKCTEINSDLESTIIEKAKSFFRSHEKSSALKVIGATAKETILMSDSCKTSIHENIRFIKDINTKKFTDKIFVEFHGCRIGEVIPVITDFKDNFAEQLAEHLSGNPTVVAHINNNNPNNSKNGNQNDYRHNKIRIYKHTPLTLGFDATSGVPVERWGLKMPNSSTP